VKILDKTRQQKWLELYCKNCIWLSPFYDTIHQIKDSSDMKVNHRHIKFELINITRDKINLQIGKRGMKLTVQEQEKTFSFIDIFDYEAHLEETYTQYRNGVLFIDIPFHYIDTFQDIEPIAIN